MTLQRRIASSRRGIVAVMTAAIMLLLLGMISLVIDLGYVMIVKTQTQAVADAAALAGAKGFYSSPAAVQSLAINCAKQNTVNGQAVALTASNVVLGTWNATTDTFIPAATTSAADNGNACQVTVSATITLFIAPVFGVASASVSSSAVAGVQRWDVVLVLDISGSFADDVPTAVTGMQAILSAFNQYSPASNVGIVTFGGQTGVSASVTIAGATFSTGFNNAGITPSGGSTTTSSFYKTNGPSNYIYAPLQPVGTNYASLAATLSKIADCSSGGPPCTGSDLAAGMGAAVALFTAPTYSYSPPQGTRKAIIFISDGASSISSDSYAATGTKTTASAWAFFTYSKSNGGAFNYTVGPYTSPFTDATNGVGSSCASPGTDNEAAAYFASWAWTNSQISVYSVLYYHGSDTQCDINGMQSLVQGNGTFINEPNAAQLVADLQNLVEDNFKYQLLQ